MEEGKKGEKGAAGEKDKDKYPPPWHTLSRRERVETVRCIHVRMVRCIPRDLPKDKGFRWADVEDDLSHMN